MHVRTYRHWALGLRGTNTVACNQAYEAKAAGYFILRIRGGGGINSGHADGVGVCSKFPIIMRYNIIFGIYGIYIYTIESIVPADHRSRMLKGIALLLTLLVMFADAHPQPHEVCNHRGSITCMQK